ncbi:hypothetical protein [Burkholderia plantarii]|uniref:hypothetical protein n=1 Tax=Burkholderia plantarii TaxID=41899 RepID=UPI000A7659B1|nr:hypothetical protein [Burkholderia plantarii]
MLPGCRPVTLEKDAADSRRRLFAMTPDDSRRLRAAPRLWKPVQKHFEAYLGRLETKMLLALLDHLASGGFGEA